MSQIEIIGRDGRKRLARKGETLQDGERFNLPLQFMDAAAREVADHLAAKYGGGRVVVDAGGNAAGHRPGFLLDSANAHLHDAAAIAYEERDERTRDAWRKDRQDLVDAKARKRRRPDDDDEEDDDRRRQENGWHERQRLARKAAEATMGTDARQLTLDEARAAADAAWEARNERLRTAWRTK